MWGPPSSRARCRIAVSKACKSSSDGALEGGVGIRPTASPREKVLESLVAMLHALQVRLPLVSFAQTRAELVRSVKGSPNNARQSNYAPEIKPDHCL